MQDEQMKDFLEPSRLDSAVKGLKTAFNIDTPDTISNLIGGGSTASMWKITVKNHPYVLRLMGLDQPIADRRVQVICAQYGARLGIAPQCYYADAENGILIMDYIHSAELTKEIIFNQMPVLLAKLHNSEKMPEAYCVIFPYMNDFIDKMVVKTPSKKIIEYYKIIQDIMLILVKHRQLASCHNDLNSENILYDGKQIYLIDFEAAGTEDPYFDLATVCQQNCFDTEEELLFLEKYMTRKPNALEIAKLVLMKQVSYCYHALHFFEHAYSGGMMSYHGEVPTFQQWYEGRKQGKYSYETTRDLILYAMVVLNQSLEEMAQPAFKEARLLLETS